VAAEVIWSAKAKKSVVEIGNYLTEHYGQDYADGVLNGIEQVVKKVAEHPTIGTPTFKKNNIRRWKLNKYNYMLYSITTLGIVVKDVLSYRMNKKGF
jgi:plasmid stabilization system protein ParE